MTSSDLGGDFTTHGMPPAQLSGLLYGLCEGVGVGLDLTVPFDEAVSEQVIELGGNFWVTNILFMRKVILADFCPGKRRK